MGVQKMFCKWHNQMKHLKTCFTVFAQFEMFVVRSKKFKDIMLLVRLDDLFHKFNIQNGCRS